MKITRSCLFIATFLMLFSHSFAQIFNDIEWYDVDSLHKILPLQSETEKINTLNRLSASSSFEDATQSNAYAQQALQMSQAVNYKEGIAAANRNFGRIAFYNGNYPRALVFYQMVFDQYQKMNHQNLSAKVLEDILVTHFYARNYEKAKEIIDSVQTFYRKKTEDGTTVGNVRDTLTLLSKIGFAYRTFGQSDKALRIYLDYLKIGNLHHFEITDMLVHHGLVALCYQELGKYDSALIYYRKALTFPKVNLGIQAMNHELMRRRVGIYLVTGHYNQIIKCSIFEE